MDPALLLIIVFIIAPLLERLLKAGKAGRTDQQQPPERRPPPQRPFPQQRAPEPTPREVTARQEDDSAATMLPDDLWEILTGEKRPPQHRIPLPEPEPEFEDVEETYPVESYPEEWAAQEPTVEPAPAPVPATADWRTQPSRWEQGINRPVPRHEAPRVVSLEELEIDSELRHERFHEKLEQRARQAIPRATPKAYRFTTDEDLRRAIIMAEVLGKPRGLQNPLDQGFGSDS